ERGAARRRQRPAEGHPRVFDRRARLGRLQGQREFVDRRRRLHEGDGRELRQGAVVVRQRVGLLEPLRGSGAPARQERPVKLSIVDLDLARKRVFIRVDFNVPLKDGKITDDTRIRASLPTIQYALAHGATAVVASHLGRPKGKPNPQMSLRPCADWLAELLSRPVAFVDDCVGGQVRQTVADVHSSGGGVVLLENLRFHPEEEKNDPEFARQLAAAADLYVNDAFGAAHRAHASVEAITRFVPVAAAGLLMEEELRYL